MDTVDATIWLSDGRCKDALDRVTLRVSHISQRVYKDYRGRLDSVGGEVGRKDLYPRRIVEQTPLKTSLITLVHCNDAAFPFLEGTKVALKTNGFGPKKKKKNYEVSAKALIQSTIQSNPIQWPLKSLTRRASQLYVPRDGGQQHESTIESSIVDTTKP